MNKVAKAHMLNLFSNKIEIAEDEILRLADFIYAHTNIKPMSKVIYVISRLLLLSKNSKNIEEAISEYNNLARNLEIEQHGADYYCQIFSILLMMILLTFFQLFAGLRN